MAYMNDFLENIRINSLMYVEEKALHPKASLK